MSRPTNDHCAGGCGNLAFGAVYCPDCLPPIEMISLTKQAHDELLAENARLRAAVEGVRDRAREIAAIYDKTNKIPYMGGAYHEGESDAAAELEQLLDAALTKETKNDANG